MDSIERLRKKNRLKYPPESELVGMIAGNIGFMIIWIMLMFFSNIEKDVMLYHTGLVYACIIILLYRLLTFEHWIQIYREIRLYLLGKLKRDEYTMVNFLNMTMDMMIFISLVFVVDYEKIGFNKLNLPVSPLVMVLVPGIIWRIVRRQIYRHLK